MATWQVTWVLSDSPHLDSMTAQGWEPFAVVREGVVTKIWLRRQKA